MANFSLPIKVAIPGRGDEDKVLRRVTQPLIKLRSLVGAMRAVAELERCGVLRHVAIPRRGDEDPAWDCPQWIARVRCDPS